MIIQDSKLLKILSSDSYKSVFDKRTGAFVRCGYTENINPQFSFLGPEILDIEISSGKCSGNCQWCYKSNGLFETNTFNMTFDQFKTIIDKFPKVLCQIAFGICDIDTNPDFFKMMEYSRSIGYIPNYTCNGLKMTDRYIKQSVELCGAVAVSIVNEKKSLSVVKEFIKQGLKYTNIHYVIHDGTYDNAFKLIDKLKAIDGFHAIIFLAYKPKGRNAGAFKSLSLDKYAKLFEYCDKVNITFGVDSCSGPNVLKSMKLNVSTEEFKSMNKWQEPCESTLFSSYVNCHGKFFPCSFTEGEYGWIEGLDVLNCKDFIADIWNNPNTIMFRNKLLMSTSACNCQFKPYCRCCPTFDIINLCKKEK